MKSWLQSRKSECAKLETALQSPHATQTQQVLDYMKQNADSAFGREHGFSVIRAIADFQEAVPIQDYSEIESWIDRIADGEPNVLTNEPVLGFEETSGSSGKSKLIPFTNSLKTEYERAAICWLSSLPAAAFEGKAYWSLSPAVKRKSSTAGGLPVGLESDLAYFSKEGAAAIGASFAVTPDLSTIADPDEFFAETIRQLLACRELSMISVWSPVFFLRLDEILGDSRTWKEIWPNLSLLSCWADAQSAAWIPAVRERLGSVEIQGKGLLSTEGVVSFPWQNPDAPTLALTSHFFEFESCETNAVALAGELQSGHRYEVILTTGGGLYRYRTGDVIEAIDELHVRFVGRHGRVSDLVGEKLTEQQAIDALSIGAKFLAPMERGYLVGVASQVDLESIEDYLRRNPYYAQARDLGQLEPLRAIHVESRQLLDALSVEQGCGVGDVKVPALFTQDEWKAINSRCQFD